MNDANTNEQHAIINRRLRRLHRLTVASLCLNGLILLLIIIGAIVHHHMRMHARHMAYRAMEQHHHEMDRGGWDRHGFGDRAPGRGPRFMPPGGAGPREGGPGSAPGGPAPHSMAMGGMGGGMGGMNAMMGADPGMVSEMLLNHMGEQLSLTEDQKTKIKPILEQQITQLQKSMADSRQAMQKQIEDGKAKIKPILNADQQKQLDAMPMPGQKGPSAPKPAPGT